MVCKHGWRQPSFSPNVCSCYKPGARCCQNCIKGPSPFYTPSRPISRSHVRSHVTNRHLSSSINCSINSSSSSTWPLCQTLPIPLTSSLFKDLSLLHVVKATSFPVYINTTYSTPPLQLQFTSTPTLLVYLVSFSTTELLFALCPSVSMPCLHIPRHRLL